MPDKLIPSLLSRYGFSARNFYAGDFCGANNFPASPGIGHLHLLRSGQLLIEHPDGSSIVANEPSCILYPRPFAHRLITPPGAHASLICASLAFKEPSHNPFVLALPAYLALPLAAMPGIEDVVELLSRETTDAGLGGAFVVDRLCDILVFQVIRSAQRAGLLAPGVLAGFADAGIARALAALHEAPAEDWKLDSMAAVAGMSRSAFASRFSELVGTTPASYLAGWRLNLAQSLLQQGQSVKAVARAVGYGTQQSFTRAFVERHGLPPTRWLAQNGAGDIAGRPTSVESDI